MNDEERIRKAVDYLDEATAKDALMLILANKDTGAGTKTLSEFHGTGFVNFAQAIGWLKSRYNFTELDAFVTEADLVYIQAGDRRILLTDRNAPLSENCLGIRGNPTSQNKNFESAWEPIVSARNAELPNTAEQSALAKETPPLPEQPKSGVDNAFEPLPKNSRFGRLEL